MKPNALIYDIHVTLLFVLPIPLKYWLHEGRGFVCFAH